MGQGFDLNLGRYGLCAPSANEVAASVPVL